MHKDPVRLLLLLSHPRRRPMSLIHKLWANSDKQNGQVRVDKAESNELSKSTVRRRWSHGAGPLQQFDQGP